MIVDGALEGGDHIADTLILQSFSRFLKSEFFGLLPIWKVM